MERNLIKEQDKITIPILEVMKLINSAKRFAYMYGYNDAIQKVIDSTDWHIKNKKEGKVFHYINSEKLIKLKKSKP